MLIVELRGTIITIRAEALTDNYFDELQRSKKDQKKSLSEILVDQDIGVGYKDFNSAYEYKGLQLNPKGELIITGFDNDSYYEEGYSFFRSNLPNLQVIEHSHADFGWSGDNFLMTIEYEVGLFQQLKIPCTMQDFDSKQLKITTSTIFTKPPIKSLSQLHYLGNALEPENNFGFEKKGLFSAIVTPKKSRFFNKTIYKDFFETSYCELKNN